MAISVEIRGIEQALRRFSNTQIQGKKGLARALGRGAQQVVRDAKMLSPVDSGLLRASIHLTKLEEANEKVVATVGTNIEYAPFVEFGTGFLGSATNENPRVSAFAEDWKGQVAQPFLFPALNQNKAKIQAEVAREMARLSKGK